MKIAIPDGIDEDNDFVYATSWGVFETDQSVHVIPIFTETDEIIAQHVTDADCWCEPVVCPDTFDYPRCVWLHKLPCRSTALDTKSDAAWLETIKKDYADEEGDDA